MSGAPKGATIESLRVERSKLQTMLHAEREAAEKFKVDKERELSLLRRAKGVTQDGAALLVQLEEGRERAEELQARGNPRPLAERRLPRIALCARASTPTPLLAGRSQDALQRATHEVHQLREEVETLRAEAKAAAETHAHDAQRLTSLGAQLEASEAQLAASRQAEAEAAAGMAALEVRATVSGGKGAEVKGCGCGVRAGRCLRRAAGRWAWAGPGELG